MQSSDKLGGVVEHTNIYIFFLIENLGIGDVLQVKDYTGEKMCLLTKSTQFASLQ